MIELNCAGLRGDALLGHLRAPMLRFSLADSA
jgi:hypothetical protein